MAVELVATKKNSEFSTQKHQMLKDYNKFDF
jgi:hypothetical protein